MSLQTPRPMRLFSEYQAEHSLAKELPYWDFFEDGVVLSDGTLAIGYKLRGIDLETWSTEQINRFSLDLRAFLNTLPDGYEIAFHREVTSNFKELLDAHEREQKKNPQIHAIASTRIDTLKSEVELKRILKPEHLVFLYRRFSPSEKKTASFLSAFFSPPKHFHKITENEHEKSVKELLQVGSGVESTLSSIGFSLQRMSKKEIWEKAFFFLNPGKKKHCPELQEAHRHQEFTSEELDREPGLCISSPREQLVFSDVIQGYDSFFIDGLYHRCITLKTLPEFTHSGMVSRLSGMPFPHILNAHVRVPEQSKELEKLQARRRMAHSMSMAQNGRASDLESEAKLQSSEELLREIIQSGQKLFYLQLSILVSASTQDELENRSRYVLSRLRELNGCEGLEENIAGFKVWKTLLPLGNVAQVRSKRVKADNLGDLLPVYEPFNGKTHPAAKPVCLFRNRQRGLVQYDPFDLSLPNYNSLVTGSSGAGKSFLNNLVLLQYVSQNPLVFVIDIGGSYRKLCEYLKGQYIEIAPAREAEAVQSINPMALPEGQKAPSPHKVKFLLSLLENLLTDGDGDKLPKLDKSLLEEALIETYKVSGSKEKTPQISDLVDVLEKSSQKDLQNYAKVLFPWTKERPYGRLLDAPSTIDLKSNFVVFDLKGLSNYPDLQAAMILIITDFILGRVENEKGKTKQIVMDECWELLKSRGSQQFMEYCVRTLRKTGSGITFITQGFEEILASAIGPAILSNTATKFVLLQRGDIKPAKEILKLNDQEVSLISSLRQVKGQYSESFLMVDNARAVIQVHPTPFEYWLSTSDAKDNELLNARRQSNPKKPLEEHLKELSLEFPLGASGGGL